MTKNKKIFLPVESIFFKSKSILNQFNEQGNVNLSKVIQSKAKQSKAKQKTYFNVKCDPHPWIQYQFECKSAANCESNDYSKKLGGTIRSMGKGKNLDEIKI